MLARAFRFSREGPAERQAIDEGGWFVRHRGVRVYHGGARALSTGGNEVTVTGREGSFAVAATSELTEGPIPIFVGPHDAFAFSAVRVDRAGD
jgi:L-ascorbate metabolism protein UlaG (beta-lactamase superfamily)